MYNFIHGKKKAKKHGEIPCLSPIRVPKIKSLTLLVQLWERDTRVLLVG